MGKKEFFTSEELSRIEEAVRQAEEKTSGEIVPYFAEKSDDYREAPWKALYLFSAIGLVGSVAEILTGYYPPISDAGFIFLLTAASGAAGYLFACCISPLRRFFAGEALLERRVRQKALEVFVRHEVFATKDRTGILLYISQFERRFLVLGDTGINRKVQESDWEDIVNTVIKGIKSDKALDGLLQAIEMCGALLEKSGVEIQPDDQNEIPNRLLTDKDP